MLPTTKTKQSPGSYKGVTIAGGSDAEVAAQIASIDSTQKPSQSNPSARVRGKATQTSSITPATSPSSITSDEIRPSVPIAPVPVPPATSTDALAGTIEANAKRYADSVVSQDGLKSLKTGRDQTFEALVERITGQKGKARLTSEAYSEETDQAAQELDDISNEILAEQNSLRRRREAIERNMAGASAQAVNDEVARATKESVARQADLSVIQLARQNRYYNAKEIADRKVEAQLEDQSRENQLLQFTYNEYKDLFNRQEQRQFETQQNERNRLLEEQRTELKAVNDLAIDALRNGAPISIVRQMQTAKTQEEAINAGGSYVGKIDRDTAYLNQANIRSQIADRAAQDAAKSTVYTQGQSQAGGFANRVEDASKTISSLQSTAIQPKGYLEKLLPNLFKSDERQNLEQAERNFINATLRRESGATITPEEFDNARLQYIPQIGDKPEVLLQKANNRTAVFNTLKTEAGSAYDTIRSEIDKAAPPTSAPVPSAMSDYLNKLGYTPLKK